MQRIIWWLDVMSMVMVAAAALLLFGTFSEALSATAFVPTQAGVALALMGVVGYRATGEKRRSDNVLRK